MPRKTNEIERIIADYAALEPSRRHDVLMMLTEMDKRGMFPGAEAQAMPTPRVRRGRPPVKPVEETANAAI